MAEYCRRIERLSWPPLNRTWRTTASVEEQAEEAASDFAGSLGGSSRARTRHAPLNSYVPKDSVKIGYEISVIHYFYEPPSLRPMAEVWAEQEIDGLLDEIIGDDGGVSTWQVENKHSPRILAPTPARHYCNSELTDFSPIIS